MIKDIKNIAIIVLIIGIIVLGIFLLQKPKEEIVEVEIPVEIEIPVPEVKKEFDTIYLPSPIKVNPANKDLLKKYNEAQDSIAKLNLYVEAVKEREYDTIYSDTVQSIKVYSKVQGKLLKQQLSYNIYPDTIQIDTAVKTNIKLPVKNKVFILGEVGQDITNIQSISPVFKGSLVLKNKKDNILSLGIDSNKNIFIGFGFKL